VVKWNDKNFHLPAHIANKMAGGATRNLVIRNGTSKLSEETIRSDMEHIHNLVIVDVIIKGTDIFVFTNSVHNALFARTCMMSRLMYKGLRVEFAPDECGTPLPTRPAQAPKETPAAPVVKKVNNPFSALAAMNEDDQSDENETEEEFGYNGVRLSSWANDTT
jgi:hypothetical protein